MEKIKKLRQTFRREKIDGYIIPKNDEFFGEYLPSYNDRLNYISNFSGSYGFSIILKNQNYLFVDGRYTLQAKNQSGHFFKIITFPNLMPARVLKGKEYIIGFDPKLFTNKMLNFFFDKKKFKLKPIHNNLIDEIWKRKLKKSKSKIYSLPDSSGGENYRHKINKVVSNLKKKGADYQFIAASENNAWLYNIRGLDSEFAPIPNCYSLIDKNKKINFFCNLNKINLSLKKKFKNVKFLQIRDTGKILSKIVNKKFLIDQNTCSIFFENIILKNNKILNFNDFIYSLKAIKNYKEIENIKLAHLHDGSALTKYLIWVKKNFHKRKLLKLVHQKNFMILEKNKSFKFSSFPTISGTGPNGAIIQL